jgi:iron complex transport system substrate-binding protein
MLVPARASDAGAPKKPQRVVSLNICTDELVLRLADRSRIASVSWLARDPATSNVTALAAHVPINYGLAEEVLPLGPDLVLAGTYTTRLAAALLQRAGVPLATFDVAHSLDEARGQIRTVAKLLGEAERGERLIAAIESSLVGASPRPAPVSLKAAVLGPNGFTVGAGTLADEIIRRAGLDNIGARLGIGRYGGVPLETVVAHAVDVLIVSSSHDGPPSLATELLRHPILGKVSGRTHAVVLPSRLWNCPGPGIAEAVETLRRAAESVRRQRTGS